MMAETVEAMLSGLVRRLKMGKLSCPSLPVLPVRPVKTALDA